MRKVNIHEAKTNLSRLIEEVEEGGDVVIARAGKPVVRLVAVHQERLPRKLGILDGRFVVPDDFDAPLPDEVLEAFDGSQDAPTR